jgi:hypothetical protein
MHDLVHPDAPRPICRSSNVGTGIASARKTSAYGLVVPIRVLTAIKRQIHAPVYVPAILPRGFKYDHWKSYAPIIGRPQPGDDWYSLTFRRGTKRIDWAVSIYDPSLRCSDLAAGSAGGIYWGTATSSGQDVWRCLLRTRPRLQIDIFDRKRPLLPIAPLGEMLNSAYRA